MKKLSLKKETIVKLSANAKVVGGLPPCTKTKCLGHCVTGETCNC